AARSRTALGQAMSQKTWGGRVEGGTDARVEAFTESISFDRRLFRQDIRGSQAHARMPAEGGLLTADEATQSCLVLAGIGAASECAPPRRSRARRHVAADESRVGAPAARL